MPLTKAMRESGAGYFYFICSKDSGASMRGSFRMVDEAVPHGQKCPQCGYRSPEEKSLIEQLGGINKGDGGRYRVVLLESPDSLEDCYLKALSSISEARERFPGADILVDYTGGTKTMSAGLVMAGLDAGCEFTLVKGSRPDLVKVKEGTERWGKVRSSKILLERQISTAKELAGHWNYAAAAQLLEVAGRMLLDPADEDRIQRLSDIARALDAWDRFEFERAGELLGQYDLKDLRGRLRKIIGARRWYSSEEPFVPKRDIFCIVYDCLLNARRRSEQERYDDAAARLYRALEMYGQYALRAVTGMRSDALCPDSLPMNLRGKYLVYCKKNRDEKGKNIAQLTLDAVYRLLGDLAGCDGAFLKEFKPEKMRLLSIGALYREKEMNDLLKKALKVRNYSYLAHGFEPVKRSDYAEMEKAVLDFISACDKEAGLPDPFINYRQLPATLEE